MEDPYKSGKEEEEETTQSWPHRYEDLNRDRYEDLNSHRYTLPTQTAVASHDFDTEGWDDYPIQNELFDEWDINDEVNDKVVWQGESPNTLECDNLELALAFARSLEDSDVDPGVIEIIIKALQDTVAERTKWTSNCIELENKISALKSSNARLKTLFNTVFRAVLHEKENNPDLRDINQPKVGRWVVNHETGEQPSSSTSGAGHGSAGQGSSTSSTSGAGQGSSSYEKPPQSKVQPIGMTKFLSSVAWDREIDAL